MRDQHGRAYGETRFRWIESRDGYWLNRRLALESPLLNAARLIAEPFGYCEERLVFWRPTRALARVEGVKDIAGSGVTSAIVAPIHLPAGAVGAVFWASETALDVAEVLRRDGFAMQMAALRLIAAHAEAQLLAPADTPRLTRREVQCLRWASKGKTDAEIGIILDMSASTVRFHLRNVAVKFGTSGRIQTLCRAVGLGFIGARAR
ncbi:LuxR family transcriptional regulator [Phenylobacterium montanum]|uniref:LuxR family transcriptional regulator n=2 Tax=Phenylobacterium montanum TaxID=2823693 RepID=A0A975G6C5_9CAUL|nr:LuxR family transcriptional regulator [Caulobacter sp. S6]